MDKKQAYQDKLQSQLDQWSAEIGKLQAKAEEAGAQTKLEYYRKIEELTSMQTKAEIKFKEFKKSGDEAWVDLKAGMDHALIEFGDAVKSATARFH